MNVIKRMTAVLMAALMLMATVVVANAAEVDEIERRYITDQIFEFQWRDGLHDDYYECTQSIVTIEHNPMAAMAYMSVEADISVCDNNLLHELSDGKIDLQEFFAKDEFDYTKAKQKEKYKNSLLLGYEFKFSTNDEGKCYDYGTWTFEDNDHNKFYGYFKEDDKNFTLYEDGTDEVLGVYPKLIGYEYLDDGTGNGGSGGANGGSGSAGGNNGTSSVTSSEYSDDEADGSTSRPKDTSDSDTKVKGTPSSSNEGSANNATKSEVSGNNPAVTPEIVSTVDALKSSASTQTDEKITLTTSTSPESHTARNVTALVVVLAVIAAGIYLINRSKKNDKNINN